MKRLILLFAALLFLSSCVTTYTDEKLANMSDDEICKVIHQYPTDMRYLHFMMARKLNCHPAQESCLAAGYKMGTKKFGECTTAMVNEAFDKEEQRRAAAQAWGQAFAGGMKSMSNYYATNPGYIAPTPSYAAPTPSYTQPQPTRCVVHHGNAMFPDSTINCY